MTPELLISIAGARSLQRMDVPGTGKPYWTVRECGMACAGMEPEVFAAMLYSYAGADECFHPLSEKLLDFGEAMRKAEDWPQTVKRTDGAEYDYLERLVGLSLVEEAQPYRFGGAEGSVVAPMYLAVSQVSGKTWMKRLAHPYATLRWRYITWLSIGRSHMARWIRSRAVSD